MAAALAHIFSFSSVEPLLPPASPAAGNGRRRCRPRGACIRSSLAPKTQLPTDFDLQQEGLTNIQKILQQRRESSPEMMNTIDNLKRLCIDHYFEEEIESAMAVVKDLVHSDDLLDATLSFRACRWWMGLGLAQEIPVARDQVLKWYMWPMAVLQGSSFSRYRIEITKIISLVYVVDDIFDLVGTLEELSLFTKAVKMWNTAAPDSLPSCMRSCYNVLYTITNEIADMAEKEHGFNPVNHLREAWEVLFDGFMVESKWLATGQAPAAEDYLRNGVVTSGVPLIFAHVFYLLGQDHVTSTNEDAAKLSDHTPPAIFCVAKILRLWDDLGSAKDEAQEGLDGSYRDLYLMENPSCTPADAEEHMRRLIKREWEELNRECFSRRTFSTSFARACFNAARMVGVMYSYDKEQKLPVLEDYMRMLLL